LIARQKKARKSKQATPRQPTAEDNLGLARLAAKAFIKNGEPLEDTEQYADACLGLVLAEGDYDSQRGLISSWFFRKASKEIVNGYRNSRHDIPLVRLEDVNQDLLEQGREQPDLTGLLETFLAAHPDDSDNDRRNRQMMVDHYLRGESMTDMALRYNMTKMGVSLAIKSAILKIRKRYAKVFEENE